MSCQQQRSVATIVTGAIVVAVYFWMALARLAAVGPNAESLVRFWATSVLILVPVGIVASIASAMFIVLIGGRFIAHAVGEIGRILMYR
ncbi:MAG TPA: hypothetical protein VKA06_06950 [Spirochaetia bacterium]|nr:hypothetical protein [Spirochaetia bacterium]